MEWLRNALALVTMVVETSIRKSADANRATYGQVLGGTGVSRTSGAHPSVTWVCMDLGLHGHPERSGSSLQFPSWQKPPELLTSPGCRIDRFTGANRPGPRRRCPLLLLPNCCKAEISWGCAGCNPCLQLHLQRSLRRRPCVFVAHTIAGLLFGPEPLVASFDWTDVIALQFLTLKVPLTCMLLICGGDAPPDAT